MISKPLWYCLKWLGLIPDPLCSIARHNDVDQVAMDLGSGVVAVGLSPTITRVAIPCRNGRVSGTRKIPACVAQQLIPGHNLWLYLGCDNLALDYCGIILYTVFVFEPAIPDAPRSLRDAGSQGQG